MVCKGLEKIPKPDDSFHPVTGKPLSAASRSAYALLPERAPPRMKVRSGEVIAILYRRALP